MTIAHIASIISKKLRTREHKFWKNYPRKRKFCCANRNEREGRELE